MIYWSMSLACVLWAEPPHGCWQSGSRLQRAFRCIMTSEGIVDRMAGKGSLWVLMAVGWVMFLALSVVEHFPQIWNTGVQVTPKNQERVYRTLKNMLGTLKLIIAVLFSYLVFQSAFGGNLPPQFLPLFLLVTLGSLAFFLVRLIRLK